MRAGVACLCLLPLAACGGIGHDDIEEVLEKEWSEERARMTELSGLELHGSEQGASRGVAASVKTARDLAAGYGGDLVGDIADTALAKGGQIAEEFGVEGVNQFVSDLGIANAKNWDVADLEVLAEREAGDAHVAQVRYSLSAEINGTRTLLGRDITHVVRVVPGSDGHEIEFKQQR